MNRSVATTTTTTAASEPRRAGSSNSNMMLSAAPASSSPSSSSSTSSSRGQRDDEDDNNKYDVAERDDDDENDCALRLLPTLLVGMALALSFAGGFWCQLAVLPVNPDYGTAAAANADAAAAAGAPEWIQLVSSPAYGLMSQRKVVVRGVSTTTASSSANSTSPSNPQPVATTETVVAVYVESVCVPYPSSLVRDDSWNAAYGVQIASWTLSGLVWIGLIGVLLLSPKQASSLLLMCGFLVVLGGVVLQGLVFLFYQGDLCTDNPMPGIRQLQQIGVFESECQLGPAAILLIVAMALYFVAGIASCCAGRREAAAAGAGAPSRNSTRSTRSERDDDDQEGGNGYVDGVRG